MTDDNPAVVWSLRTLVSKAPMPRSQRDWRKLSRLMRIARRRIQRISDMPFSIAIGPDQRRQIRLYATSTPGHVTVYNGPSVCTVAAMLAHNRAMRIRTGRCRIVDAREWYAQARHEPRPRLP